jgi:DNA-binding SARP family transcriptional activator
MTQLNIRLFGRFHAEREGAATPELEARKVQELLAYLLIHRQREHPRESLATLLWPDQPPDRARKYLRKALWQLQNGLGPAAAALLVDNEWVSFSETPALWVDVLHFEQVLATTQSIPAASLSTEQGQQLAAALSLYGGGLLPGWYEEWCFAERARLEHLYLAAQGKLVQFCELHGHYDAGIAHGYTILKYDRAHERTHRQLMRLHYLAGDRTAALRQYEQCRLVLAQELDVEPGRRTTELLAQIMDEQLLVSRPESAAHSSQLPALGQLQNELQHLQQALEQARRFLSQLSGETSQPPGTAKDTL